MFLRVFVIEFILLYKKKEIIIILDYLFKKKSKVNILIVCLNEGKLVYLNKVFKWVIVLWVIVKIFLK